MERMKIPSRILGLRRSHWFVLAAGLCLTVLLSLWAFLQGQARVAWEKANRPRSLCAVLGDRQRVDGETVMVHGTYYNAFEMSALVCDACAQTGRTWVEFDSGAMPLVLASSGSWQTSTVANVVVVGRLKSEGGPFGHLGQYRHHLQVERVLDAKVLADRPGQAAEVAARRCQR